MSRQIVSIVFVMKLTRMLFLHICQHDGMFIMWRVYFSKFVDSDLSSLPNLAPVY